MTPWHLSRRAFNRLLLSASASRALLPLHASGAPATHSPLLGASIEDLAEQFAQPPSSASPHTYWMWMNGNVSREGITLDLETMHRCGIAGVYLYSNAVGIPRGPVDYGSPTWLDMVHHAVSEAARLGVTVAMHNAPGYSGTGGPWITPEHSMQELVWTETLVESRGSVDAQLPQPRSRAAFYRDAFVLAYPSLKVETSTMRDQGKAAFCNGELIEKSLLWEGNRRNKARLDRQPSGQMGPLDVHFLNPYEARAVSIYRSPEAPIDPFDGPRDYPPVLTLQVSSDGQQFTDVCTIAMPALRSMNAPGVQSFSAVKGRYYRLLSSAPTWITGFELHQGPRLQGWAGKANSAPLSSHGPEPELPEDLCIDPSGVRDISEHLLPDGRLQWAAPEGKWTIVRIGHTTTEEEVAAAPDAAHGLECDKFSKSAVDLHFTKSLQPLFDRLGSLVGTAFSALSIDSWEAGKQNWTALFPPYFQDKRGYDLRPYVLAMTGRVVGSVVRSSQFLFDIRRTQAQMLAENYYGHFQARCHERGLKLHAEPYGDGTFESLQVAEHLDVTMAEFWVRYTYGARSYIDLASGATHTLGQSIAASEAFTGAPLTSRWTGHPYALKAEGDRMYCGGINRFVFHTFVHQPHPTAKPGMTMGPFGTHFDRNTTWMDEDTGWIRYLSRMQLLLQSGEPVADICYLKSEEPSSGVPDARSGKLAVPAGFAVDVVSADSVMQHATVQDRRVSFRAGMSYRCMILPPLVSITPELLRRVSDLVRDGMTLITSAIPSNSPSLEKQPQADTGIAHLTSEIWGDLDGKTKRQRTYGQGTVFLTSSVEETFRTIGLLSDFEYSADSEGADILFQHRRIQGDDVYLVSNQRRRSEQVVCSFRVTEGRPELWDADHGGCNGAPFCKVEGGRTQLRLGLEPSASILVIFRRNLVRHPEVSVLRGGRLLADSEMIRSPRVSDGDLTDSFCLSIWAQPETYAMPNAGFLAIPEEGTAVYGAGHCIAGIAAGQNGVRVYERSSGPARVVLQSEQPISGWTHIAVVYRYRQPHLYINGVEVAAGKTSDSTVHPARDCKSSGEPPRYFEGNMMPPELTGVLSSEELRRIALAGPPAPELPHGLSLDRNLKGKLLAIAWTPGTYQLFEGTQKRTLRVDAALSPAVLDGPWGLRLPAHAGAPRTITLPTLIALNQHDDFDVQHFSGTVTYSTTFNVEAKQLEKNRRLFLDLGRVDVVGRVRVNGQLAGTLWKPPYRLPVTDFLRFGENRLEVDVTTLWPNRLIGDESLPAENEYDSHGPIKQLPAWYSAGEPKPGQRVTFSCWHHYGRQDPLLQSGLSGPAKLLQAIVL